MTIAQKQALSAALVGAAFLVLGILQAYVVHLPTEVQIPVVTFLATLAHLLPTMGTAQKVDAAADKKAAVIVTDLIDQGKL